VRRRAAEVHGRVDPDLRPPGPKDYLAFSGAASEIVFWIFCFLAIAFAIYLLW
jgi:hypothetical protein